MVWRSNRTFRRIKHALLFPSCPPLVDLFTFDWQHPLVTRLLDCGRSSAYSDRNAETALMAATRARKDAVCKVRSPTSLSGARKPSQMRRRSVLKACSIACQVLVDKGRADIHLFNRFRVNAFDVAVTNRDMKTLRGESRAVEVPQLAGRADPLLSRVVGSPRPDAL